MSKIKLAKDACRLIEQLWTTDTVQIKYASSKASMPNVQY